MLRILACLLALGLAAQAQACGPDSDCLIGDRSYRIALPDTTEPGAMVPAILFAHGYKGTAKGVMRNKSLRALAGDLGAALIAVQSAGPGWDVPNNPRNPKASGAAEYAYFDAVLDDATARFPVDGAQVLATGFSSGAMMIWNLACARPEQFSGFVPVSGTFWKEPPPRCAAPAASLLHIHGDADEVVPLKGRAIGPTRQGEVAEALKMYGDFGGFGAATEYRHAGLRCRERENEAGNFMAFCLFEGGHSLRTEHLRFAWEKMRSAGQGPRSD